MKLKLEHLAPYLPYGLKLQYEGNRDKTMEYGTLSGLSHRLYGNKNSLMLSIKNDNTKWCDTLVYYRAKPILRPLSDLLNKDLDFWIDFGEEIGDIQVDFLIKALVNKTSYSKNIHDSFEVYQALLKFHFDIFGLIDKGLAIDINTLKK